jgi:hypothetical protein
MHFAPTMHKDSLLVVVVLGMTDSSTTRSHLHISPDHRLDVAHAIFVAQLAGDDVREDLEFPMRMCWETLTWLISSVLFL